MELRGATALVTGGAHRVGRGLTLALAAAGCNVFVHYNSSAPDAEDTAQAAREHGVLAATGRADLSDAATAEALVAAATAALGPVRILVNSASGFPDDTLGSVTAEGWRRTFAVTLEAPVFLTQVMAAGLPPGADGAVVNVTDWRTARPYPDHFSYSVAKGALDAFTRAAAVSLAPRIRVNAVALGAILPPPGAGHDHLEKLAGTLPLRRSGSVDEVAAAVLFLLRSDFVTGEIVRLDGGAHLA